MRTVIKYLISVLFLPIWVFQLLVPRKKNVWIFGAWYGNRFSDNSKYLYLYTKENRPDIKAIWITRDKKMRDKIVSQAGYSYLTWSLKSCYYSLIAKNVIVSSGKTDVNRFFTNGANMIQLWHGNPMKKIGLDDKLSTTNTFFNKKIEPILFPFFSEFNYDYIVSNSTAFSDKMASAFNIPLNKVLETGCPRNDVFYNLEKADFNNQLRKKFNNCKIVYYLPTFRNHKKTQSLFNLKDYNSHTLQSFLVKENIVFVSKGHYVDNVLEKDSKASTDRIIHLKDDNVQDINFMLKDADLLITDYSGAYFDFLLTQKPIIFSAFDLEEYKNTSRELYFEYEKTVSGPIVTNWEALRESLLTIFESENYVSLIKEKNTLFNKFHDSNNSKRTFEAISNL